MGPANFDDVREFLRFLLEFSVKGSETGKEYSMSLNYSCNMHDSWETIVARLTSIDMIIRMH